LQQEYTQLRAMAIFDTNNYCNYSENAENVECEPNYMSQVVSNILFQLKLILFMFNLFIICLFPFGAITILCMVVYFNIYPCKIKIETELSDDDLHLTTMDSEQFIHPESGLSSMRSRGEAWWTMSQDVLETKTAQGDIVLTEGTCYMFLEEEFTKNDKINVFRYGNVFMGDRWVMRKVAVPKDHPDGNTAPYYMVDARR
jgi:hypothetical protein